MTYQIALENERAARAKAVEAFNRYQSAERRERELLHSAIMFCVCFTGIGVLAMILSLVN